MKKIVILLSFFAFSALGLDGQIPVSDSKPFLDQVLLFIGFISIIIGMFSSGYALTISLSAYAACEKSVKSQTFIPAVMPGSQGLYSFAIAFLMIQNMHQMPLKVCLAGMICGFPCWFSAIGQAKTAAACIKAINSGLMDQGQALLATGVPELYALTGLASGFLIMI